MLVHYSVVQGKRYFQYIFLAVASAICILCLFGGLASAASYYVTNTGCSDTYQGTQQTHTTGTTGPWCSFTPVNNISNGAGFSAGDKVLLQRGVTWNQELVIQGNGTTSNWNELGVYGTGTDRAKIIRNQSGAERAVWMRNPSYWKVHDLEVGNAGSGLVAYYKTMGNVGLDIQNIYAHDIYGLYRDKIDNVDAGIVYSGAWSNATSSAYYQSTDRYSNSAGNYAQFTFTGTDINWIGSKDANHGKVDVYIDGILDTSALDTYSASFIVQTLYTKTGLTNASHTIKIVLRSDHNASSSGYYTDVDAFMFSDNNNLYISSGVAVSGSINVPTTSLYPISNVTTNNITGTRNQTTFEVDWQGRLSGPAFGTYDVLLNHHYHYDDNAGNGAGPACSDSLSFHLVQKVTVMNTILDNTAACYTDTGTAAVFSGMTTNITFVNGIMINTPNTNTYDQTAWDFEGWNRDNRIRNSYIASNYGPGIEVLTIWGDALVPSPYSDGSEISGNVFENNGSGIKQIRGATGSTIVPSGTISNNLYYEPAGFMTVDSTGSWSGFTTSNNRAISSPGSIYPSGFQFSGTQGGDFWSFQSYNGSSWSNLAYYDSTNKRWQPSSSVSTPNVSQFEALPDSCASCKIARVWTAPTSGTISIRGRVLKSDIAGGDGIIARITKNGTRIWPVSGDQTIAYNNIDGVASDLDGIVVASNDVIRFEVEKNANNTNDTTSWSPAVAYTAISGGSGYQASSGFSSTQGATNWSYQSWNGSAYSNMTWDSANTWWSVSGTYSIVGGIFQHGDATDSVRKFIAPQAGNITITGNVAKWITGGDGVNVKILKNGTQIWPASGWQFIANDNTAGYNMNVSTSVAASDVIYFILNKNVTTSNDSTLWDPLITYTGGINGGFENPSTSTFVYAPFTNGWTFVNGSGVQHNGSAFGAANAPEGVQTAFLQADNQFYQSITFSAGSHSVSFQAAKRTNYGGTQSFNVYYDSTLIGSYTPSSGSFASYTTSSFTATAGSHIIKFVGTTVTDNTDFIDAVTIN